MTDRSHGTWLVNKHLWFALTATISHWVPLNQRSHSWGRRDSAVAGRKAAELLWKSLTVSSKDIQQARNISDILLLAVGFRAFGKITVIFTLPQQTPTGTSHQTKPVHPNNCGRLVFVWAVWAGLYCKERGWMTKHPACLSPKLFWRTVSTPLWPGWEVHLIKTSSKY